MQTPVEISAKILLAEDDNDMRRFLVKALQNAGYAVTSFDNGLSAYNRLREEPFELLLTDIVMPEMDGIELARRATELDPEIKVMFITGFAAVALNPDNAAPKDARILSKPFHLRDLVNEVERLLRRLEGGRTSVVPGPSEGAPANPGAAGVESGTGLLPPQAAMPPRESGFRRRLDRVVAEERPRSALHSGAHSGGRGSALPDAGRPAAREVRIPPSLASVRARRARASPRAGGHVRAGAEG